MKSTIAGILAAAGVVAAQYSVSAASPASMSMSMTSAAALPSSSTSYTTSIWDDCTDMTETMTVIGTLTSTYCSHCMMSMHGPHTVYTTSYVTTWSSWCPPSMGPSGSSVYMTPVPYTCTESWTGASTPPWSSDHIPAGMTTQTHVCHVCAATPVTSVMTFPTTCSSWMPGVSTVAASTTPASAPAPIATPTPATVPLQSNYVATQTPVCSGPGCPVPTTWGNTTGITPFQGGASAQNIGAHVVVALAGLVLLFAVCL